MLHEHFETISGFDDCPLFLRIYTPQKVSGESHSLQGVVMGVHGFSEHTGRYRHVVERICSKNMACVMFDLRGHGRSGFSHGDAQNGEVMISDVQFVFHYVQNKFGSHIPYKIFGHSLGGLLVTYMMGREQNPHIPIFLSSPCYGLQVDVPLWKKYLVKNLVHAFPALFFPTGAKKEFLSKNVKNNEDYMADPLCLKKVSLRMGTIIFDLVNENRIKSAIQKIPGPVVIAAGAEDLLCSFDAVKKLSVFYKNATLYPVEHAGHEIFNELPEYQQQAFAHFDNWLLGNR
jgi:acylglycerol lipase